MGSGNFLTGLSSLESYIGIWILPIVAVFALCAGIFAFGGRRPAGQWFVGSLVCLLGPAFIALAYGFAGSTTIVSGADAFSNALLVAGNFVGNVICPLCAAWQVIMAITAMTGFIDRHQKQSASHHLIAAVLCCLVSALMRLFEGFVKNAHTVSFHPLVLHGGSKWLLT